MMNRILGKLPPRRDPRTLMLAKYTAALPPAPAAIDWTRKLTAIGSMGNDALGDCTCAAIGHLIQAWTAANGGQVILPDTAIVGLYEKACGYDPADPASDQGGVELDVLAYWRKNGVAGHGLDAYAAVSRRDHGDVRDAVWLFGGAYIGVALPLSAQSQNIWTVVGDGRSGNSAPGSWGGHAIPVIAYDDTFLSFVSWGQVMRMTWAFWDAYCDEAYACISRDWAVAAGAPSGFSWDVLDADLAGFRKAA